MVDIVMLSVCSVSAFFWLVFLFMSVRWWMSEHWESTENSSMTASHLPRLSVIVPARNECASLSDIAIMARTGSPAILILSCATLIIMAVMYLPTVRFLRLCISRVFTLPVSGVFYMAMTVSSAISYFCGRHVWRGERERVSK